MPLGTRQNVSITTAGRWQSHRSVRQTLLMWGDYDDCTGDWNGHCLSVWPCLQRTVIYSGHFNDYMKQFLLTLSENRFIVRLLSALKAKVTKNTFKKYFKFRNE
jgi:hypothetical protein